MRERIPATTFRFMSAAWIFMGLWLVLAVAMPVYGVFLAAQPQLLDTALPSSGRPVDSIIGALPIGVQGALFCIVGLLACPLILFELLAAVGRVGHLELAEQPTGVLLLARGAWWPWRFARRFEIPRGSTVEVSVARAGRTAHGALKAFLVELGVGGTPLKGFEVRIASSDALKRVSLAPLREAVEHQGGSMMAHDGHARAMLEPTRGR